MEIRVGQACSDVEKRGQTLLLLSLYIHDIWPMQDWAKKILGPMALVFGVVLFVGWVRMLRTRAAEVK